MQKIIECVPNFSEGKDQKIIDAIADAIRSVSGVSLLDVDAGKSTNRTVYTFVGSPEAVVQGALASARIAYQLIDMTKHHGEHKRLGAMDVCPFIPVTGVTMDDCVECAHQCGKKLSEELNVPVYLYGYASKHDYRRQVPQIRTGEYEGLSEKLKDPAWKPDYGPSKFVPTFGATIVGARKFLIAYNVNLISTKEQAHRIALIIRSNQKQKGRLDAIQAMGWYLKEQNIAQVTVNILDHEIIAMHQVYEEVVEESVNLKLPVTGSEVVGMIPLKALLDVAEFYMARESLFVLDEDQKIHLAIQRLGLNSLSPFDPEKRIIEYIIKKETRNENKLINQTLTKFVYMVGDRTSAPGGGSVGAAIGALGVALSSMVAKLSYGRKMFDKTDSKMRQIIPPLHNSLETFLKLVDDDTESFQKYSEAKSLPQNTNEEIVRRQQEIENGIRYAIEIPMASARHISKLWPILLELVHVYHLPTSSDLLVGVQCLKTAVYSVAYNVFINLKMDDAKMLREEMSNEIRQHISMAEEMSKLILDQIEEKYPIMDIK